MPKPVFARLKAYYESVGRVLREQAGIAAVFANTGDIGSSRERIYARFLQGHLPASCTIVFGGFLFDRQGKESKQVDLIVMEDTAPQFNFMDDDGGGKVLAYVDGCIAVIEVKSNLDAAKLREALDNFAHMPDREPITEERVLINCHVPVDAHDWPLKIIYAARGASHELIRETLVTFYAENPGVPFNKRPNVIHVGDSYCITRESRPLTLRPSGQILPPNTFFPHMGTADAFALPYVVNSVGRIAAATRHIQTDYGWIMNEM